MSVARYRLCQVEMIILALLWFFLCEYRPGQRMADSMALIASYVRLVGEP